MIQSLWLTSTNTEKSAGKKPVASPPSMTHRQRRQLPISLLKHAKRDLLLLMLSLKLLPPSDFHFLRNRLCPAFERGVDALEVHPAASAYLSVLRIERGAGEVTLIVACNGLVSCVGRHLLGGVGGEVCHQRLAVGVSFNPRVIPHSRSFADVTALTKINKLNDYLCFTYVRQLRR